MHAVYERGEADGVVGVLEIGSSPGLGGFGAPERGSAREFEGDFGVRDERPD
jgi:hypothetical protein